MVRSASPPRLRRHPSPRQNSFPTPLAQRAGPAAALVLLAFAAYLPALQAGFIWDDDDYVTANEALRSLGGLWRIWTELGTTPQYYPLVHTTFWIEYQLWELNAVGYHAVNILLHGLGAAVLWRLLSALHLPGAWLAAAIFTLHPVHVESVAWITERKNVLSGLFYFLSLGALLRWLALRGEESLAGFAAPFHRLPAWDRPRAVYALSFGLFVCALLSKTVTVTLPCAALVIVWWRRGAKGESGGAVHGQNLARGSTPPSGRRGGAALWRLVPPLLPFLAAGVALGLVTVWMEKNNVGARGDEWSLSPVERWLVAGRALWFYAAKLAWPYPLIFVYPRWILDPAALWQHLFPAAALALMGGLWILRHRLGRGPLAAVLLFAGTLFPALGFFDVYPMRYSFVADHFQYLASVALIVPAAFLLARFGRGLPAKARQASTAALFLLLGSLTWMQCHVYNDLETLWRSTLARNPSAGIAHNNLGNLLTERENYRDADKHYAAALQLDPRDDYAHYNLGVSLYRQGRLEEAARHFRETLSLNPRYVDAWFNLGLVLMAREKPGEAAEALGKGLALDPNDAAGHAALAGAWTALGRGEEAARQYRAALALDPANPDFHFNLGALLMALKRPQEARKHLEMVLRLRPADQEARELFQRALQARPGRGADLPARP